MNVLVIDGNSILNRAFYGIKLLTTKDGRFTNGIYGFMNIFLKLLEETKPQAVAVAFDLRAPTFRHKMYDGYKAGRKGMPPELASQMPVLKEILISLGYKVLEKEGFEADDILGTVSEMCGKDDMCYLATGDRDSFQLVKENVTVILPRTKMGSTVTEHYTPEKIKEEYGVSPLQMIDIKALQGDSSDNIPGVAGVGPKTAGELIKNFGSIGNIYDNLESLPIKDNLRAKLENGRESAFLSYTLGKIIKDVPIGSLEDLIPSEPDVQRAKYLLSDLEMFKILDKLNLDSAPEANEMQTKKQELTYSEVFDCTEMLESIKKDGKFYFTADFSDLSSPIFWFLRADTVYCLEPMHLGYFEFIAEILTSNSIEKITDNSKHLYRFCLLNNIEAENVSFDTSLAGYILNPSSPDYSAVRLCSEYHIPAPVVLNENKFAANCAVLKALEPILRSKIEANGQNELLCEIEMPLARVLASMEHIGVLVDKKGIYDFGVKIKTEIDSVRDEIYSLAGEEFNINSPKQLGTVLFEKLHIPSGKKTKSGYSTNAEILENLKNDYPIVEKILWYRTLTKLHSTYCEGLLKAICEDGRIHSSFIQTETRTGRISSTEPNLQNIPVRKELGKEMRKFFIAPDGSLLADADYSQIELRVLAHIADDKVMIETFNNEVDIHTVTASQVFGIPQEMVTPLMRSRAKAVNFGIVYGIGAFSLAKDIGVTRKEADNYIKGYLNHYSGVNEYMENIVKTATEQGYVDTLQRRRRYLPELSASNAMLRAFGQRVARNMPIQGTAADIIKIAMVHVYRRLKEEKMKSRLILQVHDELIVEAPEDEIEKASKILSEEMENACKMKVRLRADVGVGKTWFEAKD